jgi:hypothetical protein
MMPVPYVHRSPEAKLDSLESYPAGCAIGLLAVHTSVILAATSLSTCITQAFADYCKENPQLKLRNHVDRVKGTPSWRHRRG